MSRTVEPGEYDLAAALVAAFPSYIQQRLGLLGVALDDDLDAVVATTVGDLAGALQALANVPPQSQVKSPLELVREATIPITGALSSRGIAAPDRDEWTVAAHPEDVYDLYPASSRDLSEEAWRLHVAWGIDKARLVAGVVPSPPEQVQGESSGLPAVALFGIEQVRRDTLLAAFAERGYRGLVWRNPAALETIESPVLVFVDLRHPKAHDAIRALKGAGTRVVAVADQMNDLTVPGIMALGATEVLELSRVVAQLDRLLPRIA
ncbi:MAG: hypothetical protein GY788_09725 [bacterium]|nr:hypothetical protein [bacterium]